MKQQTPTTRGLTAIDLLLAPTIAVAICLAVYFSEQIDAFMIRLLNP
jgi:hypothetical protein